MKLPLMMLTLALVADLGSGQAPLLVPLQYSTIQGALLAAQPGDLVLVDPGVYAGPIDFLGKDVVLRSVAGASLTSIENPNGVVAPLVQFVNGEATGARLEGFAIRGGRSQSSGAGIRVVGATPLVSDCIIENNETLDGTPAVNAANGAGVFVTAGGSPRFERCRINDNRTGALLSCPPGSGLPGCATVASSGGGAGLFFAAATFVDCEFFRNACHSSGGGLWVGPGAFLALRNCVAAENSGLAGAAGAIDVVGRADIRNSSLSGNDALTVSCLRSSGTDTKLIGCFVVDHPRVQVNLIEGQNLEIAHCTIANNNAGLGGISSSTIVDSILWNNLGLDELAGITAAVTLRFCVLRTSNLAPFVLNLVSFLVPPAIDFVDPANGDYHLLPTSPAIGAAGFGSLPAASLDIDGDPRRMGSQFDAGADEYRCGATTPLRDPNSAAEQLSLEWFAGGGASLLDGSLEIWGALPLAPGAVLLGFGASLFVAGGVTVHVATAPGAFFVAPIGFDGNGRFGRILSLDDPALVGQRIYLQAFAAEFGSVVSSNGLEIVFCD